MTPWTGGRLTVRDTAPIRGRGLFTGAECEVALRSRESGGIVFRRVDLPGTPEIPARSEHIGADPRLPGRNTILALDPSRPPSPDNPAIATVEHVMSALAGMGVTDTTVEVCGPEVPIDDGSAASLVAAISEAGTSALPGEAVPIVVHDPAVVRYERDACEITVEPSRSGRLELSYTLDYSAIGGPSASTFEWVWDPGSYARDVAPARTFCLEREAVAMRRAGHFDWVTSREMLVLDDRGHPFDNVLRFSDEPARHKLLDLLGDLSLAGAPIVGRFTAVRSGHALNAVVARTLRQAAAC